MINGKIRMALFTGIFVGIIVIISEYMIPLKNSNLIISLLIAGGSALVGGLISIKLFLKESR
ncbi:hypothetical protein [Rossellomorea sp. BNER]|uniref:hypothetical protein n=1 Tax=Rossellomorea sp. BNER TaxID=2962031 RepID=UPI003AF24571|nr:hypothetical protein [Rossellomorea sp. BNER]